MERYPLAHLAEGLRCFVCGPHAEPGLGVRFELAGDHVEATWDANGLMEGWPGLLHGAAFGALHDEAAAWAMIAVAARTGFTRRMEVRYLQPLRIGQRLTIRGRPAKVGERSGTFETAILLPDGSPASTATVEFAFLGAEQIGRIVGRPLSPQLAAWLAADDAGRRAMLREFSRALAP